MKNVCFFLASFFSLNALASELDLQCMTVERCEGAKINFLDQSNNLCAFSLQQDIATRLANCTLPDNDEGVRALLGTCGEINSTSFFKYMSYNGLDLCEIEDCPEYKGAATWGLAATDIRFHLDVGDISTCGEQAKCILSRIKNNIEEDAPLAHGYAMHWLSGSCDIPYMFGLLVEAATMIGVPICAALGLYRKFHRNSDMHESLVELESKPLPGKKRRH